MGKHRVGNRRIITVSIPEDLARRLDARIGKGRGSGRSATITKMIEKSLSGENVRNKKKEAIVQKSAPSKDGEIRIEKDTMGDVEVPAQMYFGAQTARSLINFNIGEDKMPRSIIKAFGILKMAAAEVNIELEELDREVGELIIKSCEEVISGKLDYHFPLRIWQELKQI